MTEQHHDHDHHAEEQEEGSWRNGRRMLLNGPLQFQASDLWKMLIPLVGILAAWFALDNQVKSNSQDIRDLATAQSARQAYFERMIVLEERSSQSRAASTEAFARLEARIETLDQRLSRHIERFNSLQIGRRDNTYNGPLGGD